MGNKYIREPKTIDYHIKPGTRAGYKDVLTGESDWVPDYGFPGDLIISINEVSKKDIHNPLGLKRVGDNLIMTKNISLKEALVGFKFRMKHFDDRVIEIVSNEIITFNTQLVVKNEGMPKFNDTKNGDLIIKFNIEFPEKLSEERKKYLDKILVGLPVDKEQTLLQKSTDVEVKTAVVDNTNYSKSNTSKHNTRDYIDEEEDGGGQE